MSGKKKMQTHGHTIRVWLVSEVVRVPLSTAGRGLEGKGMFSGKAEAE